MNPMTKAEKSFNEDPEEETENHGNINQRSCFKFCECIGCPPLLANSKFVVSIGQLKDDRLFGAPV